MTSNDSHTAREMLAFVAAFLHADSAALSLESSVGDVPGWDSFAHVNLLMRIEENYKIAFEPDDLLSMETLGDILGAIERLTGGSGSITSLSAA
jgi:acyl carrier protein